MLMILYTWYTLAIWISQSYTVGVFPGSYCQRSSRNLGKYIAIKVISIYNKMNLFPREYVYLSIYSLLNLLHSFSYNVGKEMRPLSTLPILIWLVEPLPRRLSSAGYFFFFFFFSNSFPSSSRTQSLPFHIHIRCLSFLISIYLSISIYMHYYSYSYSYHYSLWLI